MKIAWNYAQWRYGFVSLVLVVVLALAACGVQSEPSADESATTEKPDKEARADEDEDPTPTEEEEDEEATPTEEEDEEDPTPTEEEEDEEATPTEEEEDEDPTPTEEEQDPTPVEEGAGLPVGVLLGQYTVSGSNADGTRYEGTMNIEESGATYQIVWEVGNQFTGTGIRVQDQFITVFGEENVCGLVAYEVLPDNTLDGVWAIQGTSELGTEQATPLDGQSGELAGAYSIVGTNPNDGSPYEGGVLIEQTGDTYQFSWEAGNTFVGTGILRDDVIGVVYGEPGACGMNMYQIEADGTLDGLWTTQGTDSVSDERGEPRDVVEQQPTEAVEDPAAIDTPPDLAITQVVLSRDNGTGEAGEEVSLFTTDDFRLHFTVYLDQLVNSINASFVMFYLDEDIRVGEITFDWDEPLDYITAYFEPTGVDAWPTGTYEIEVYLNGELTEVITYQIEEGTGNMIIPDTSGTDSSAPPVTDVGDYETITDETETLQIEVPIAWGDRTSNRWVLNDQEVGVAMRLAPSIDGYLQTWETPGVFFGMSRTLVSEQGYTPQSFMDTISLDACTFISSEPYEDQLYTGVYNIWGDCGGIPTEIHGIVFTDQDNTLLGQVEVQVVTDADREALARILNSFQHISDVE